MRILKDRIVWDAEDWLGGFVLTPGSNRIPIGKGLANMSNFNPFTLPGVALPGYNPSSVTNVTGSIPDAVLVDVVADSSGDNAYSVGGGKVHQISISGNSLTTSGAWPHSIAGAGAHGAHSSFTAALGSVAIYNVSGSSRLFYSYNDATDWDVGTFDLSATFDDDFMSSAPTTPLGTTASDLTGGQGKAHPLYVAEDDILYIGSGRFVHSYKGSTSTFNSQVLDLPVGYEVVGFAEKDYDLVIFATTGRGSGKRAKAHAFFWSSDRPDSYYKRVDLQDDDVAAPFHYNGTIGCFTSSRNNGNAALRLFDGTGFAPKYYFTNTSLPSIGGVDVWNNLIIWNASGAFHAWGSYRAQYPEAGYQFSSGSGTSSGFLKALVSGNLYASTGTGTSGGLESLGNFSTGSFNSLTAYPEFGFGQRGKISGVQITSTQASSGGRSFKLSLVSETAVGKEVATITSVASTQTILKYFPNTFVDKLEQFDNLRLLGQWLTGSGATDAIPIQRVEVFYEPIDYKQ